MVGSNLFGGSSASHIPLQNEETYFCKQIANQRAKLAFATRLSKTKRKRKPNKPQSPHITASSASGGFFWEDGHDHLCVPVPYVAGLERGDGIGRRRRAPPFAARHTPQRRDDQRRIGPVAIRWRGAGGGWSGAGRGAGNRRRRHTTGCGGF